MDNIIVLDYTTGYIYRGRVPKGLTNKQIEKLIEEKGLRVKDCSYMVKACLIYQEF